MERDYRRLVHKPLLEKNYENRNAINNQNKNSDSENKNTEIDPAEFNRINPFGASSMLQSDLEFFYNNQIPGRIRRPQHFFGMLNRLIEFMKEQMIESMESNGKDMNPNTFLFKLNEQVQIDNLSLRCTEPRLKQLLQVLKFSGEALESAIPLIYVATFASLVATYEDGFRVLVESSPNSRSFDLRLVCCDPAYAIRPVFDHFKTIAITSGTLSPMDMYSTLLDFKPQVTCSIGVSLSRPSVRPVIVTRGNDQVELSAKFQLRTEPAVVRNYGQLLVELSKVVPDGMIAFFASYSHLEYCCTQWYDADGGGSRIMEQLEKNKLVFIEVSGSSMKDLNNILSAYKLACESGRGAIMLAVARGRISEGIDFTEKSKIKMQCISNRIKLLPTFLIFLYRTFSKMCLRDGNAFYKHHG